MKDFLCTFITIYGIMSAVCFANFIGGIFALITGGVFACVKDGKNKINNTNINSGYFHLCCFLGTGAIFSLIWPWMVIKCFRFVIDEIKTI